MSSIIERIKPARIVKIHVSKEWARALAGCFARPEKDIWQLWYSFSGRMRVTEVTYFDRIPETDFYAPSSDELIAEIYRLFGALSVSFLPGPTGWQCQSVIGRKTYTGTEQPTMADSAASLFVILSEIFNQK